MPRSLDSRRLLNPNSYARSPHAFGRRIDAAFYVPDGGDERSMRAAQVQHLIAARWHTRRGSSDTAVLARRWGCSVHVIYRVVDGSRWASATILCALIEWQLRQTLEVQGSDDPIRRKT
jgi:hypothetical protein